MRSLRLVAAILALCLVAAACSDDGEGTEGPPDDETTTTVRSTTTTTSQPPLTVPTTQPPEPPPITEPEPDPTPTIDDVPDPSAAGTEPPPAPANLKCLATSTEGEILVEFDALSNPDALSSVRAYLGADDGPMINQGFRPISEVDTAREGGTRWAVAVRSVPAGVPLRLAVGSFNLLNQESGWWPIEAYYNGPGNPCGDGSPDPVLPPTTCTAGCDEEEGEPGA